MRVGSVIAYHKSLFWQICASTRPFYPFFSAEEFYASMPFFGCCDDHLRRVFKARWFGGYVMIVHKFHVFHGFIYVAPGLFEGASLTMGVILPNPELVSLFNENNFSNFFDGVPIFPEQGHLGGVTNFSDFNSLSASFLRHPNSPLLSGPPLSYFIPYTNRYVDYCNTWGLSNRCMD